MIKVNSMKFKKLLASTLVAGSALAAPSLSYADDDFVPILSFAAGLLNEGVFPESDQYTVDDEVYITAEDGITIDGNIFVPNDLDGPAPAIIFISSWAMNEYEYVQQAGQLAEKGYVVLSYEPRGFGNSGGIINTAGPKDMSDFSKVVDHLIANYPVDENAIGAAGISYGAGISVIGAAHDSRIKAVSAMSGWGSLSESLYGNQSPRLAWGTILTLSADLLGNPDPIVAENWGILKNQELDKIPEVMEWAAPRSPSNYVNELNENGTAIYFGKAYNDNLFHPNSMMKMFSQLTVPKHMDLLPGTHASADLLPPLLGFGDMTQWNNTFEWFDHHLKGENNAIAQAKALNMKIKFEDRYESFDDYPIAEATPETFYLHPRGTLDNGDLDSTPYSSFFSKDNTINAITGNDYTTGIPLISPLLEQFEIPTVADIPGADNFTSIYFNTWYLSEPMQIRGTPTVSLQVQPKNEEVQLVAYLYDEDAFGNGTLITHGVITLPNATSGEKVQLDFELVTTAYDVPAGHKVTLAIDTKDPHYKTPTRDAYFLDFEFSKDAQSTLTIPTL